MNYYLRHLGDYARDAAHLSMMEHGAYSLLLDRYYTTEAGIPADQAHRIARARTKEEKQAVDAVLGEFFQLENGIWKNRRAEEEITKANSRIKAAQENGKRGGRPKRNPEETQEKPTGFSSGSDSATQAKAHQTPDTTMSTDVDIKGAKRRFDPLAVSLPVGLSRQAWESWIAYRRERRLSTTEKTIQAQAQALAEWSREGHDPAAAIEASIRNGWQGLFPPKQSPPRRPSLDETREAASAYLTGRTPTHEQARCPDPTAIPGEARRVAG